MPTLSDGSIAIAICDRCKMKRAYTELGPDGNSPGLRVCQSYGCADERDPYRLPARQSDPLIMQFPRPDASLAVTFNGLVADDMNSFVVDTNNSGYPIK